MWTKKEGLNEGKGNVFLYSLNVGMGEESGDGNVWGAICEGRMVGEDKSRSFAFLVFLFEMLLSNVKNTPCSRSFFVPFFGLIKRGRLR